MDKTLKNLRFNTLEALSVAISAYRLNNKQVICTLGPKTGTKEQIIDYFLGKSTLIITDADQDTAQNIKDYLIQKVTISKLTGTRVGSFTQEICDILDKDQISVKHLGILAWAPKMYEENLVADSVKEEVSFMALTSRYLGREGDKIELEFHPIRVKYLSSYDMFVHDGHDGKNNIVSFFNKKKIDTVTRIRGKVKDARRCSFHANGETTILNYVKVL